MENHIEIIVKKHFRYQPDGERRTILYCPSEKRIIRKKDYTSLKSQEYISDIEETYNKKNYENKKNKYYPNKRAK